MQKYLIKSMATAKPVVIEGIFRLIKYAWGNFDQEDVKVHFLEFKVADNLIAAYTDKVKTPDYIRLTCLEIIYMLLSNQIDRLTDQNKEFSELFFKEDVLKKLCSDLLEFLDEYDGDSTAQ